MMQFEALKEFIKNFKQYEKGILEYQDFIRYVVDNFQYSPKENQEVKNGNVFSDMQKKETYEIKEKEILPSSYDEYFKSMKDKTDSLRQKKERIKNYDSKLSNFQPTEELKLDLDKATYKPSPIEILSNIYSSLDEKSKAAILELTKIQNKIKESKDAFISRKGSFTRHIEDFSKSSNYELQNTIDKLNITVTTLTENPNIVVSVKEPVKEDKVIVTHPTIQQKRLAYWKDKIKPSHSMVPLHNPKDKKDKTLLLTGDDVDKYNNMNVAKHSIIAAANVAKKMVDDMKLQEEVEEVTIPIKDDVRVAKPSIFKKLQSKLSALSFKRVAK